MAQVEYAHIGFNADKVPIIEGTRVKVWLVALDHAGRGWDAHEIHRQYPHLSLGQIHSALAYYYDHRAEMDAVIQRNEDDAERLKREIEQAQGPSPLRAKLKSLGKSP